jgi:hypothetical protein
VVALAAAATTCTPFKTDPPGDAGGRDSAAMGNASDATMGDASDATIGNASDATMDDEADATMSDAADATMGDASDAAAQCFHKAPPSRPTVMGTSASLADIIFAVSDISERWSDGGLPAFKDIGFDLDNTCTGEGQGDSCLEPPWATADHTDGIGGVDNAWARFATGVVGLESNTPRALFRVRSYSGQPDDAQVEVSMYASRGLAPRAGDGDGGSDEGGTPLWDGNDRFNIMPELLVRSANPSVDEPLYRDAQAYVSGGMLVAHFPTALWSPSNPLVPYELLPATQLVLAGLLTYAGGQWALQDTVVDMRIQFNDLLTALAQIPNPDTGELWCHDARTYFAMQQPICSSVDIASVPGQPQCDAISMAALIQAKQVQLGDVLPPSPQPAFACATGIDPTTDTCELPGD